MRNHTSAILACDFFVTITARFRTPYVFVILDVGTRRIVHWNVTEHPTAEWTVQLTASASLPLRSWEGCITNIAWNRWQHEP